MRRPERNIEIFSMSVLDMFASALGAFIMVSVILFPYFNQKRQLEAIEAQTRAVEVDVQSARDARAQAEEESRRQQQQLRKNADDKKALDQCQADLKRCRDNLSDFLVVAVEWDEPYDVDLIIKAPDGFEFSFSQKTRPPQARPRAPTASQTSPGGGSVAAELSLDMRAGPGIEVWQDPRPEPGEYTVFYSLQSARGAEAVVVQGWVIDRLAGRRLLEKKTLKSGDRLVPVAKIAVHPDGTVDIRQATP